MVQVQSYAEHIILRERNVLICTFCVQVTSLNGLCIYIYIYIFIQKYTPKLRCKGQFGLCKTGFSGGRHRNNDFCQALVPISIHHGTRSPFSKPRVSLRYLNYKSTYTFNAQQTDIYIILLLGFFLGWSKVELKNYV